MKNIILIALISLLTTACGSINTVPERNAEVLPWQTYYKIKPEHISTNKPYSDISNLDFVLLKAKANYQKDIYIEFMKRSLELVGFEKVLTEEELTKLIVKNNLATKISSTTDMLSLHNAKKELGKFLVIESELTQIHEAKWETYVKITNPENIDTLLEARMRALAIYDVDKEFNYPVVNLLYEWKKSSK